MIPDTFAENVPDWIKNNAGWWATDQIDDSSFLKGIQYLIQEGIMVIPPTEALGSSSSQEIPDWVKNNAGWWANDKISEVEFVNAITYLIKIGIIIIESSKNPELIAEMWINDDINDDEFLANVEQLIEKDIITIQTDSITKTSQLPDWLVNNAGWWAARILTNSDFNFDPVYVKEEIYPCNEFSAATSCFTVTYNSHGFRGNEFQEQKHQFDLRIFTLGGSTTYGSASNDDETWPAYLQQIINDESSGKKIQVLNAGVSAATTESEYEMIRNKIISLEPDLIIMYDGWNDFENMPVEKTIENWKSMCKLGKNEGFDTIIVIQPLTTSGHRVLTEQEITKSFPVISYLEKSQQYVDAFDELDKVCTKTADFRRIFDYVQEPIFYDAGHTINFGNKIIAENVFSVISPIYFEKTYSVIHDDLKSENNELVVYAVGSDLSYRNFDNLNLQNAVFDKADLSNTSFKNTNIDGARFVYANLSNSNLLDRTNLSNINLAGTDLSKESLKGKDLSGANLSHVDLSKHDLTGTNLSYVNLSHVKLSKESLKGKDLSGANLSHVDLSKHDLTGTNLSNTFLLRTNLSEMDLRTVTLANADFRYAILSESKLPDSLLANNNFDHAILKNINFAGKDLSGSSFNHAKLEGSDMQNTNLTKASFVQVDFTKIKNKSLDESNLTDSSFAHSNLSGVSLDNVTIDGTNFWKTNLSGQDFRVIEKKLVSYKNLSQIIGAHFIDSNLSNANFEGIDMFRDGNLQKVFKNKAHLKILPPAEMKDELFGTGRVLITSSAVSGNDLIVQHVFYNDFRGANLENANFKNTDLKFANFYQANLTNADLSGADLTRAFFKNANLTNANLEGADLQNVILDNAILSNANLGCVNHQICD